MKCTWLKASLAGLVIGWLTVNPQPAHGQIVAVWAWRNLAAPQIGGPWIAPDIRFRPLGILDGDPIWRSAGAYNQSLLTVTVPDDDAQVWVQGQLMQGTGKQRIFVPSALDPGFDYVYEIRVRSGNDRQAMDETRTVPIRIGQQVIVDFTRPAMKIPPPPVVR